jgi:predicted DNA-binding protein
MSTFRCFVDTFSGYVDGVDISYRRWGGEGSARSATPAGSGLAVGKAVGQRSSCAGVPGAPIEEGKGRKMKSIKHREIEPTVTFQVSPELYQTVMKETGMRKSQVVREAILRGLGMSHLIKPKVEGYRKSPIFSIRLPEEAYQAVINRANENQSTISTILRGVLCTGLRIGFPAEEVTTEQKSEAIAEASTHNSEQEGERE